MSALLSTINGHSQNGHANIFGGFKRYWLWLNSAKPDISSHIPSRIPPTLPRQSTPFLRIDQSISSRHTGWRLCFQRYRNSLLGADTNPASGLFSCDQKNLHDSDKSIRDSYMYRFVSHLLKGYASSTIGIRTLETPLFANNQSSLPWFTLSPIGLSDHRWLILPSQPGVFPHSHSFLRSLDFVGLS